MSSNSYNAASQDCIVLAITSSKKKHLHEFELTSDQFLQGELLVPSKIRYDKLICIKQQLIISRVAKLRKEVMQEILSRTKKLLEE